MNAPQRVYLDAFLAPLAPYLGRRDVTDLYVNRPGELWLDTATGSERHEVPALDDASLWRLARQIAAASDQGINREHPLLAATLPDGARVQICAPPATRGHLIVAIRKHSMPDLLLSDYDQAGAFSRVGEATLKQRAVDDMLAALLEEGRTFAFLSAAVQARRSIVVSGGTGTGKTTFLNALLKEASDAERFVLIEVTPAELVEAALRLRPDRIIMGEVRGPEAISWLRAVGTGHPGSITTVHANSPGGAIEQLAMMSMSAGTELGRAELIDYIRATVDVFVQLGQEDGTRLVTEVEFSKRGE